MRLKERLYRFMCGRYGSDSLSRLMLVLYVVLSVVSLFISNPWVGFSLWLIMNFLVVIIFYRMFSRKIYARQRENQIYMNIKRKIGEYFKYRINKWKFRKTHVYKKCSFCKAVLRLPKKKGEHNVKCPKCSKSFKVKI